MRFSRKPVEPDKAKSRLEALCASSEHCSWELMQKLKIWRVPYSTAAEIVESLVARRFVDDERFARAFVRDKYRFAKWGRIKIRAALAAKRVPRWMIEEAFDEIDEALYEDALDSVLRSKIRSLKEEAFTYEGRTKLFRYAASRGFEPNVIASRMKRRKLWEDFKPKDEWEED